MLFVELNARIFFFKERRLVRRAIGERTCVLQHGGLKMCYGTKETHGNNKGGGKMECQVSEVWGQ